MRPADLWKYHRFQTNLLNSSLPNQQPNQPCRPMKLFFTFPVDVFRLTCLIPLIGSPVSGTVLMISCGRRLYRVSGRYDRDHDELPASLGSPCPKEWATSWILEMR